MTRRATSEGAKLTENELIYLMAYVDGQVDDDEIPEVEALIAKSDEARQIVAQHAAMGDWVRASQDERAVAAGADDMARVVMAKVEELGGASVISFERERSKRALNQQRMKEFSALGAVAAVAAAFFLWPSPSAQQGVTPAAVAKATAHNPAPTSPLPPPAPLDVPPGAVATAGEGVDIDSVESPSHPVSVFYVPAVENANASSVVVWIDDQEPGGH